MFGVVLLVFSEFAIPATFCNNIVLGKIMFVHPMWDPVFIKIANISVRWYGIAYFLGIILVTKIGNRAITRGELKITLKQFDSFITASILGIIVGGRLGYMLVYQTGSLIHDPLSLFKIWQGGMSFHGGFLGVFCALIWNCRKNGELWSLCDFVCRYAPIGLFFGRFANFINGELYGRIASSKHWWLMVYPWVDNMPRHPSQIYEMLGEGVLLFLVLNTCFKSAKPGVISAMFCIIYGLIRFLLEFFRQPDVQLGFIWHNWLTMGQLLSIPLILIGFMFLYRRIYARKA